MGGYVKFVIVLVIIALIVYLIVTVDFKNLVSFNFFDAFKLPGPATDTVTVSGGPVGVEIRKPETPFDQPEPPAGFTVNQLSPYYQKIRINSVSRGFSFGSMSSVVISASNLNESVNVTGWTVRANKGTILSIPKGISDYSAGSVVVERDILLSPSDYMNIYDTVSSFGFDLRFNKCTGYLSNTFDFEPELPRSCPSIDRSEIASFSGRCQSFIFSLGSCGQPTAEELNSFSTESACHSFLNNLNYGGCYNRYRSDNDFFAREWRVSLGRDFNVSNLDQQHDRILLFDRSGLLVDQYIY